MEMYPVIQHENNFPKVSITLGIGLSTVRNEAIISTNADVLSTGHLRTNFGDI